MNTKQRISRRDLLKMSAAGARALRRPCSPRAWSALLRPRRTRSSSISIFAAMGRTHWVKTRNRAKPWPGSWIPTMPCTPTSPSTTRPSIRAPGDGHQQWAARRLQAQDGPDLLFGNWTYLIEDWMTADLVGWWDPLSRVAPTPMWKAICSGPTSSSSPASVSPNGQTAWLGLDNTTLWSYYNKDLFAANGWEAPDTWADQIALFQNIREAGLIPTSDYFGLAYAVWTLRHGHQPGAAQHLRRDRRG